MEEVETTEGALRLARVAEELLRMREEELPRLRVWEYAAEAGGEEGPEGVTFGAGEPDPDARERGLREVAAKLHVDGVLGWAHVSLDLSDPPATLDRESYLNEDHCIQRRVPFDLGDGYRLDGRDYSDAEGFARGVVATLREELETLGRLQSEEEK